MIANSTRAAPDVNAGEKMHQRAGVKLHQDGMPKAPREGFCWATNRMRSRIALTGERSRDVKRCLTKHAPVASLVLRPSPQLLFHFINQCLLTLALWSCGRRVSVVQAQRQILRAFAGQLRRHLRTASHASCCAA